MRQNVPKTDVVLESKLNPIDNLWDLRNHSENRYPDEILETEKETLALY